MRTKRTALDHGSYRAACWILCVITVAICASSVNSNSSQKDAECLGAASIASLDIIPDPAAAGKSGVVKLPRSAAHLDVLTDVEFSLAWDSPQGGTVEITADFFYNAQVSLEYPIFKVQFFFMDGETILEEESYDYTQSCANPRGYELFAGDRLESARFAVKLSSARAPHVRAVVWGGMF